MHECEVPIARPPSFVDRVLRRSTAIQLSAIVHSDACPSESPLAPLVKAAYAFVVENYRVGDDVV